MLRSRIIPALLVHNGSLVKTINFKDSKYVGDPLNAVRIFNEKRVDELMILDIGVSSEKYKIDFNLLENIAHESRMPLCYGGGIKSIDDAEKLLSMGFEKIALSSHFLEDPKSISIFSKKLGSQSIVIVLDIKKVNNDYEIFTHNGLRRSNHSLKEILDFINSSNNVGEVVINSIDKDGLMSGYDLDLAKLVYKELNIPLTILGGLSGKEDIRSLIKEFGIIGIAGGSFFVFKGKFRAVLISYPTKEEKEIIFKT